MQQNSKASLSKCVGQTCFCHFQGVVRRIQLFWNINWKNFEKLEVCLQKTNMFIIDDHYL
jgi:hypothetical protein